MTTTSYFITGTDTGCGKTEVTLGLMALYQSRGERVLGMKPVASGAEPTADGLRNEDALKIQEQGSVRLPYEQINPYAFAPPIAPHLAARQAGVTIQVEAIRHRCQALSTRADRLLVEGVGGWQVPLNEMDSVADLAHALGLPVILVVGMRLGCINHALLSAQSIVDRGCELAGWVANMLEPEMLEAEANIDALRRRIPAPLLARIPFMPTPRLETIIQALSQAPELVP
jgi:dethiobiotin synthetase